MARLNCLSKPERLPVEIAATERLPVAVKIIRLLTIRFFLSFVRDRPIINSPKPTRLLVKVGISPV